MLEVENNIWTAAKVAAVAVAANANSILHKRISVPMDYGIWMYVVRANGNFWYGLLFTRVIVIVRRLSSHCISSVRQKNIAFVYNEFRNVYNRNVFVFV